MYVFGLRRIFFTCLIVPSNDTHIFFFYLVKGFSKSCIIVIRTFFIDMKLLPSCFVIVTIIIPITWVFMGASSWYS